MIARRVVKVMMSRSMKVAGFFVLSFLDAAVSPLNAASIHPGGTMLGVSWGGSSYHVDVATGTAVELSRPGHFFNAMAKDNFGNFYASDNWNRIYSIDPITGAAQLRANISGFGNSESIRGMAYSNNGQLYAVSNTTFGDIARFFKIDLSTGDASLVGSTGMVGLQSLAVAPDNTFYSFQLSGFGFGDLGLVSIDPATGLATDINALDDESSSGMQSLAFGHAGDLYGMGQGGGGQGIIFRVDTTDGHLTQLALVPVGLRGMEFLPIPEPRSLTLLLIASTALVSRRAEQRLRLVP